MDFRRPLDNPLSDHFQKIIVEVALLLLWNIAGASSSEVKLTFPLKILEEAQFFQYDFLEFMMLDRRRCNH